MAQVIGVPKEIFPGEKRVATVPEVVPKLAKLGFGVIVQSGAGVSNRGTSLCVLMSVTMRRNPARRPAHAGVLPGSA